jgi:hypothetical protein
VDEYVDPEPDPDEWGRKKKENEGTLKKVQIPVQSEAE